MKVIEYIKNFNVDMTMVYMNSGDMEIKGEYEFSTDSIINHIR